MNQNRVLFIQIQIIPPRMHKWREIIDFVYKTTWKIFRHHLLTKTPIEFKGHSTLRNFQPQNAL